MGRGRGRARLENIAGAGLLAFAIAGPWYVTNFHSLWADTQRYSTLPAQINGDPKVPSVAAFDWYLWNLFSNQLYLIPFLFLVAGIAVLFVRADARKPNVYPLLIVVGNYVLFSLLYHKDDRYSQPMLAGIAILATYWLDLLRPSRRRLAIGLRRSRLASRPI